MKLQEIFEEYLAVRLDYVDALDSLRDLGMPAPIARELLALYENTEWERTKPPAPEPPEPNTDRRQPVKVQEIREKYLEKELTSAQAIHLINEWMCGPDPAPELLTLWARDQWNQMQQQGKTGGNL